MTDTMINTESAVSGHDYFNVESIELDAASLDAAMLQASELWQVSIDDLENVVLEDSKRLFGLLGKKMKIKVSTKHPLMFIKARDFVDSLMNMSELDLQASIDEDYSVNIDGEDSAIVIGRHGETLKALEFLANLIYRSDIEMPKIRFDCGGYKIRREESLMRLAESVSKDVRQRRTAIALEPMSSWERRIIHMTLQDDEDVVTSSEGEYPYRRVVIHPAGRPQKRAHYRKR